MRLSLFRLTILAFAAALLALRPAAALDASSTIRVTKLLQTRQSWDGRPLLYPAGPAEVSALLIEFAPGAETGWHLHPVPSFAYILQGTLEVSLKDGRKKTLRSGDALAEVVDTLHNGRNIGPDSVKLIVFYAGTADQALTRKETPVAE